MTERYDNNLMPHKLDIKCPSCGAPAEFEFAVAAGINQRKEIPFFESSHFFDDHCFDGLLKTT